MKPWIGSILENDTADSFRELRNDLEKRVNHLLKGKQYGEGLSTWDLIIAIISRPPNEHVKYKEGGEFGDIPVLHQATAWRFRSRTIWPG
jgi:hypothetical protein